MQSVIVAYPGYTHIVTHQSGHIMRGSRKFCQKGSKFDSAFLFLS